MEKDNQHHVVTRIAPSPTGLLHVGTARVALVNFLYARQFGGRFLVRIEDTDKARSTKAFEEDILTGLCSLGLTWDDLVRQSDRVKPHTAALARLIDEDKAYVSHEPAKDDPSRRVDVVRLRNPGRSITFVDEVRGEITFDTTELGDLVIARAIDDPLYHFAVVVDDADMGITHVIRGEDHISNTPRQILIQEALGYTRPTYAHLPLILAPDRSKLSKRKGAVAVTEYLRQGYFPEALVNFLALMGWNPGTEQEIFTLDELVTAFSLAGIQKGGAVFDIERLKWMNREHRKRRPRDDVRTSLAASLRADHPAIADIITRSDRVLDDILERFSTNAEIVQTADSGGFSFYETRPTTSRDVLQFKKDPAPERTAQRLAAVRALLAPIPETTFIYDAVKDAVWPYAEAEGRGSVLWPLRVALSGLERSPDPFVIMEAVGKDETLARVDAAVTLCL
jgi:glutamyl-tRNA synthetase